MLDAFPLIPLKHVGSLQGLIGSISGEDTASPLHSLSRSCNRY